MLDRIKKISDEIQAANVSTADELESFRIKYLSKKGLISGLFDEFREIPPEKKREVGQQLNELKQKATERFNLLMKQLQSAEEGLPENDLTRPAFPFNLGSRHPISIVRKEIIDVFARIGFIVSEGPEIEDDNHVFSKLNFSFISF